MCQQLTVLVEMRDGKPTVVSGSFLVNVVIADSFAQDEITQAKEENTKFTEALRDTTSALILQGITLGLNEELEESRDRMINLFYPTKESACHEQELR